MSASCSSSRLYKNLLHTEFRLSVMGLDSKSIFVRNKFLKLTCFIVKVSCKTFQSPARGLRTAAFTNRPRAVTTECDTDALLLKMDFKDSFIKRNDKRDKCENSALIEINVCSDKC